MDTTNLGIVGVVTATFAIPLLVVVADDLHKDRHRRRPVTKLEQESRRTRSRGHPMGDTRRS